MIYLVQTHMIGYLKGEILQKTEKYILLDVSGVGYKVFCNSKNIHSTGNMSFFIHTVVREDALELFGFTDEVTLSLFQKLISISGIGPRSALSIVGVGTTESLIQAIQKGDLGYMTAVSGIGKKTAEKIILELRGAISDILTESNTETSEVIMALKSLGYSEREAQLAAKESKDGTVNERIRHALKYMGK